MKDASSNSVRASSRQSNFRKETTTTTKNIKVVQYQTEHVEHVKDIQTKPEKRTHDQQSEQYNLKANNKCPLKREQETHNINMTKYKV